MIERYRLLSTLCRHAWLVHSSNLPQWMDQSNISLYQGSIFNTPPVASSHLASSNNHTIFIARWILQCIIFYRETPNKQTCASAICRIKVFIINYIAVSTHIYDSYAKWTVIVPSHTTDSASDTSLGCIAFVPCMRRAVRTYNEHIYLKRKPWIISYIWWRICAFSEKIAFEIWSQ